MFFDYYNLIKISNKKLGQNYLINKKIINKIISTINPKKQDVLVEIGPGLGSLTKQIIKLINFLKLIEIDKNLVFFLKNQSFNNKIKIYNENAIKFDYKKIIKNNNKIRIFGNIPYNISTKLLFHLLKYYKNIKDITFLMQKELAARIAAKKNNKTYGRLSVIIQYLYKVKLIFNIPPNSFKPKPKVYSTLIQLTKKNNLNICNNYIKYLIFITKISFNKRRKIIKNSLKNFFSISELVKLGINYNLRAENLSIHEYCILAKYLFKNNLIKLF